MSRKRPTGKKYHDPNDKRELVLGFIGQGLMTQTEAAQFIGVTRQRVHQWAKAAGLQPVLARHRYLKSLLDDHRA